MFRLEAMDHAALAVRDVARSVAWYQDVLGLDRMYEEAWGDYPAVCGVGGTAVALFPVRAESPKEPVGHGVLSMRHLAFRADAENFRAARDELGRKGIELEFQDHGIAHSIYFSDPDGHTIEITTYDVEPPRNTRSSHQITQVLSIDYVVVFVRQWERAVSFYSESLGLEAVAADNEQGVREFRMPGAGPNLLIEDVAKAGMPTAVVGKFVGVSMAVRDIQATYKLWSHRGVRFEGPPAEQPYGGMLAHFFDPDDNMWSLVERGVGNGQIVS